MIQKRTMSNMESILDLNNHAVAYLCKGDHSATTSTLREAIKSLEECFCKARDISQDLEVATSEPPRKRRRPEHAPATKCADVTKDTGCGSYTPIRIITVSDAEPSTSYRDDTALLNLFDRAFQFPSTQYHLDYSSQQSRTRLAAILLYNLGLSYHKEGICQGTSKDLKMALKFYREAYVVLKSAWANSDFKDVFVLLMALLNNMSCIHAACFDVKDAHQCIDWMNGALASRQRSMLSKKDYTFFSLNLSVFRGHQLRYAGAA